MSLLLWVMGYFGCLSVLLWDGTWMLGWYWVGALLSGLFVMVDRYLYVFSVCPEEQLSLYVKHLLQQHRYIDSVRLLLHRGDEQKKLISRSVLFVLMWIVLGMFVVTSTGSRVAIGLMMGIGLRLGFEFWRTRKNQEIWRQWLFWPVSRTTSVREARMVVGIFGVSFVVLTLLLLLS